MSRLSQLHRLMRFPTSIGRCLGRVGSTVLGAALAMFVAAPVAAQQGGTITGRITTTVGGEPLSNVAVSIGGTTLGAMSTDSGRYQILNVPPGTYQVSARRLGFTPKSLSVTVRAGGSHQQDFTLDEAVRMMEGVVVTGEAGAVRRREIGNTVTQLAVAAELKEPTKSVEGLLQGRATGLVVAENAGAIGGGAQIRLRGNGSYTMSNTPLIFVDGARIRNDAYPRNSPNPAVDFTGRSANVTASPLNDINPNDIERIEVIKGAAATALYGTEAAGGVIQIFTKRGKPGSTRWTVRIDQGFRYTLPFGPDSDPYMRMDPWMRGAPRWLAGIFTPDLVSKAKSRFEGDSCAPSKSCADFATATSSTTPLAEPYTYEYPGVAGAQTYFLSASGGLNDISYFLSGSSEKNQGILPNDDQTRYSIRGNFAFDPRASFKVDWNTSLNQDNHNQTRQGGDVQGMTSNAYRGGTYIGGYTYDNMTALLNQTTENAIGNVTSALTLSHKLGEKMDSRFAMGISRSAVELRGLRPFGFRYQPAGALTQKTFLGEVYTVDYSSTYRQNLGDRFGVALSWGAQAVDKRDKMIEGWSQNFPGPGEPTMESGGFATAFEERIRVINAGFFTQARFDMLDRLFVTVGLRVDGNSAFGQDLGLQPYPKLTASYMISDESFWPKALGSFKLRGAVGEAGRAPGAFDAIRTWNASRFGSTPGFLPRNLGNSELGPERTREYEAGFEASWWEDKLTADFTYYYQKIRDALLPISNPASLGGWLPQLTNVGIIENRGTELSLNARVLEGAKLGWDVGLGFSTNKNKLLSQGGRPNQAELRVGHPVPAVYGTMILNRRKMEAPVLVRDTVFGPNQPTIIIQPSMSFRFARGISLSGRGEYQGGFYVRNTGWSAGAQRTEAWPTCENYPSRIAKNDFEGIEARFRAFCNYGVPVDANLFVFDATFFKVRDITLSLPLSAFSERLRQATLNMTARNAIRWTNSDWLELDPEMIGRSQAENTRGVTESMPPASMFTMSLTINF
jgi:TonB-linked SusC/RagA family outer membrane protein